MAKYFIKGETLTNIADAIRSKTGETAGITVNEMAESINSIPESVGLDTSDATIESGAQMLSGVTAYGANGKVTGTIPSQTARTIIPTESSQIAIDSGTYASGVITVAAIPSEYVNTSDATATAEDIANGKVAYSNGVKITGTHECEIVDVANGVETCSVTMTVLGCVEISYVKYFDNAISICNTEINNFDNQTNVVITDIVANSIMVIHDYYEYSLLEVECSENISTVYGHDGVECMSGIGIFNVAGDSQIYILTDAGIDFA